MVLRELPLLEHLPRMLMPLEGRNEGAVSIATAPQLECVGGGGNMNMEVSKGAVL